MTYCDECGKKVKENSKFCSNCGVEFEENIEDEEDIEEEPVRERIIVQKSRSGITTLIVVLIILGVIFFLLVSSGALDEVTKGSGVSYVDPCEREFNNCNRDCGEGWGSGLCKAVCTEKYHKCKGG